MKNLSKENTYEFFCDSFYSCAYKFTDNNILINDRKIVN